MTNTARVTAAVSEFLNIWSCGGNASLTLDTKKGGCTVNFTAHLGHPGALLQPTPVPPASPTPTSPTSSGQRYRGPASPRSQPFPTTPSTGQRYRGTADRQRSRVRAANYQAAAWTAAPTQAELAASVPLSSAATEKVTAASEAPATNSGTVTAATVDAAAATEKCEKTLDSDVASTSCQQLLPPPADVKCWNCEHLMTPEHQCEEHLPSSSSGSLSVNCGLPGQDSTQSGSVNAVSSQSSSPPGSPRRTSGRRIFPKKFVNS